MKCTECGRRIYLDFPEFEWNDWMKLSVFLGHLRSEGEVTEATFEEMMGALLSFKPEREVVAGVVSEPGGYSIDTGAGHVFLSYEQVEALDEYRGKSCHTK